MKFERMPGDRELDAMIRRSKRRRREQEAQEIIASRTLANVDAAIEKAIETALDARGEVDRRDLLREHITPAQIDSRFNICRERVLQRRPELRNFIAA